MTLDAHDPSAHPVDCPECRRMNKEEEPGPMHEHYKSANAKGAKAKFDATERSNKARRDKEERG